MHRGCAAGDGAVSYLAACPVGLGPPDRNLPASLPSHLQAAAAQVIVTYTNGPHFDLLLFSRRVLH